MNLKKMGHDGVSWIQMAQETFINWLWLLGDHRVPEKWSIFVIERISTSYRGL
jgi:hypothetical protein